MEDHRYPRHWRGIVVAALLAVAVVINLVQFHGIETTTPNRFEAYYRYSSPDIVDIMWHDGCLACQQRFGLHLALWVIAPGSTVIVDSEGPYGRETRQKEEFAVRLFAWGNVATVDWVDATAAARLLPTADGEPADFDPTPYVIATGPGGTTGAPWALAIDPQSGEVPTASAPDAFVSETVTDGLHLDGRGAPREFVIVGWDLPRQGSTYDYQDLVVETSLLPDDIRQELTSR